jgi:hypothetical protein
MALPHEVMFYEVMWRAFGRGAAYPIPWWVQQYLRRWVEVYDDGLFDSKEAAFSSNAGYRYWNMVGVKDRKEETLVGQTGDIEPVYDQYAMGFFLFFPTDRSLSIPHLVDSSAGPAPLLTQRMEDGYLPVVLTTYRARPGLRLTQRAFATTTIGARERSLALARLTVTADGPVPCDGWLCAAVLPAGPSGFQRHDRAGRYLENGAVSSLRYRVADRRLDVNGQWGPVLDTAPEVFGLYGNPRSLADPDHYLQVSPFADLAGNGGLNGRDTALDPIGGLCTAVFAWPFHLPNAGTSLEVDIRFPIDDYRGDGDLAELTKTPAQVLDDANVAWWRDKLQSGLRLRLPSEVAHLWDLARLCRANLLILADDGAIHPGPTIYDEFWVRDSSVEGIACALIGENGLPQRQFSTHYPALFNLGSEQIGPARAHGFFGGEHERDGYEWDSNGEALWALGRFDRLQGPAAAFGAGLYAPYVLDGARWIRDNRSRYGLLHSGWSAEHLGGRDQPHYWDDLWGITGLYEAARLAERIGAQEVGELWQAHDDLATATRDSIRWVLSEQARRGAWETYVPTGPGDVGRLDSTMVGALAYFHPCRLYMGARLGDDIDRAFRFTLETIWGHFVTGGGFRHDSAWHAYGPYLTLQLAHAFLLVGDVQRMDACLRWSVGNAGYATVSRSAGDAANRWDVVQGAWNEQHAYPIASDFSEVPDQWWYMGDIPHGWAAAELLLLLRDIALFEADEDGQRHLYLAPGLLPHWLPDGDELQVADAPTLFDGARMGYRLRHDSAARTVRIEVTQPAPPDVHYVVPCRFGAGVEAATADGVATEVRGLDVILPAGTRSGEVKYHGH